MKKNNNSSIDKLTKNTDKQLMQLLMADLNNFRNGKGNAARTERNKQAA